MTSDIGTDSITSRWPLPATGVRFLTPQVVVSVLAEHVLTRDLYPLACGFYPRAAGHRMRRRSHDTDLLIYCIAGRGSLQTEASTIPVKAGDLMILRAGQRHAYSADATDPWSILWVHFTGLLSAEYTALFAVSGAVAPVGVQARLISAFEQLLSLRHAGFSLPRFVQGACLLKSLLADLACSAAQPPESERRQLNMERLTEQMRENLGAELDLDALALTANLSKFHFIRRFKAHTGHAPIQRFIQMKMQRACELLDSTDKPIKVIAGEVGYQDPFYFSRIFKRTIGVSPQTYRQQHAI